jgi:hypothetical protein
MIIPKYTKVTSSSGIALAAADIRRQQKRTHGAHQLAFGIRLLAQHLVFSEHVGFPDAGQLPEAGPASTVLSGSSAAHNVHNKMSGSSCLYKVVWPCFRWHVVHAVWWAMGVVSCRIIWCLASLLNMIFLATSLRCNTQMSINGGRGCLQSATSSGPLNSIDSWPVEGDSIKMQQQHIHHKACLGSFRKTQVLLWVHETRATVSSTRLLKCKRLLEVGVVN